MDYTVTLTDWRLRRGGYRVRCFGMPRNDWNAMGQTAAERYFRTYNQALAFALELVAAYKATFHNDCAPPMPSKSFNPPAQA